MSVQPRERTNLAIMYKIVLVLPTSRQYCHVTTQGRYMHFNLSDFVGARRGSVVTPSICADCQHNYCPIGFPETLTAMRRSAGRSIPSNGQIDHLSRR